MEQPFACQNLWCYETVLYQVLGSGCFDISLRKSQCWKIISLSGRSGAQEVQGGSVPLYRISGAAHSWVWTSFIDYFSYEFFISF